MTVYYNVTNREIAETLIKPFNKESALKTLTAIQVTITALQAEKSPQDAKIQLLKTKATLIKDAYIEKARRVNCIFFFLFGVQRKIQKIEEIERLINPLKQVERPLNLKIQHGPLFNLACGDGFLQFMEPLDLHIFSQTCKQGALAVRKEIQRRATLLNITSEQLKKLYPSSKRLRQEIAFKYSQNFQAQVGSECGSMQFFLFLKQSTPESRLQILHKMAELDIGGEVVAFVARGLDPSRVGENLGPTPLTIAIAANSKEFIRAIVEQPLSQADQLRALTWLQEDPDAEIQRFVDAQQALRQEVSP